MKVKKRPRVSYHPIQTKKTDFKREKKSAYLQKKEKKQTEVNPGLVCGKSEKKPRKTTKSGGKTRGKTALYLGVIQKEKR